MEDLDTKLEDHAADGVRYGLKFLGAKITSLADVKTMNEVFNKRLNQEMEKQTFFKKKPDSTSSALRSKGRGILTMEF